MPFSIDVVSSALTAQGAGPFTSAQSVTVTTRLDEAGDISIPMPATDARTAYIVPNTLTYVRVRVDGDAADMTRIGIIKSRTTSPDALSLSLTGPDLAGELAHTHVGTLALEASAGSGTPMLAANVLSAILSTTGGLDDSGWTWTGTPSKDVYHQFGDETRLAALGKLAELTGDHWRVSATVARRVEWLTTTPGGFNATDSGLRAVMDGSPDALADNDDVCLIVRDSFQRVADANERITRVYPRGSGNAGARLYLNSAAAGVPAGYTMVINPTSPALSYIKHDASDALGVIAHTETFRDIGMVNDEDVDELAAANMLKDAAVVFLRRRLLEQNAYRLSVTKVHQSLQVGQSLRLICRRFEAGYGWIDVNADVMVLEMTRTWTAGEAEPVYALQVTE